MRILGLLLLICGALVLIGGFGMDTTVPTELGGQRVHNIGLMSQKQNLVVLGAMMIIVGAVFFGFWSRADRSVKEMDSSHGANTRQCLYCAEIIKRQAVICRFCNRELGAFDTTTSASPPEVLATHDELMAQYDISHDGEKYQYQQYRYEKLEDAVAYARDCQNKT